jgi:hypothetical protein
MNGTGTIITKGLREPVCPFCHVRVHSSIIIRTGPSPDTIQIYWCLEILDFPAYRTQKNKLLFFINDPV